MPLATLTTKGQITIPKTIRSSLHLNPGDKIEFIIAEGGTAILKPLTKKVADVFGKLYVQNQQVVSVDEMNQAIKKRFKEKFK